MATRRAKHHGLAPKPLTRTRHGSTKPILIASWGDVQYVSGRPFIMIEHGAGQKYGGDPHPDAQPDLSHTCGLRLILCPSEEVAGRNRLYHAHATAAVVGSAKVERYAHIRAGRPERDGLPVVAFAWHWPSTKQLTDESRWAFPHWQAALAELAAMGDDARGYRLLGHGHPKAWPTLRNFYRGVRVRSTDDPEEVIRRADVLVADNTSMMFEAAAVNIPVVMLDAPWYDLAAPHGLRWGFAADIGLHAGSGTAGELHATIVETLTADPQRERRAEISGRVYERIDGATAASVAAISDLLSIET